MKPSEAIERLQAIRIFYRDTIMDDTAVEAVDLAISALEKQTVDKCCETCRHRNHTVWKRPCNGCYLTTSLEDYWEPYTEEEA